MQPLLTAAQMRDADRHAIDGIGIPELVLMEHAAVGLAGAMSRRFGKLLPETRGLVLAGTGNNGGDVVAAARLLHQQGCERILVVSLGEHARFTPSLRLQLQMAGRLGIPRADHMTVEVLQAADWVLDGIFGTGLTREVDGPVRDAIDLVNDKGRGRWIVSADIPSGLSADRGVPLGAAVQASETITLGFLKRGLVTGLAAEYTGAVRLETIGIPRLVPGMSPEAFLYDLDDARRALPARSPTSHKGTFGHVVVFAGPGDKEGAAALAGWGAVRAGAGLVTVAADGAERSSLRARLRPEVMVADPESVLATLGKSAVAVIGPGLGTGADAAKLLAKVLESPWPLVIDADGTTLIAGNPSLGSKLKARSERTATVLTPHPKEAARLLGTTVDQVQGDRFRALSRLVSDWGAWVLLKGKGSAIQGPGAPVFIVDRGGPVLAKGGTGDVLSGIVGGLLAQGAPPQRAAALGAYLHGRAAEIETDRRGPRFAAAGDIADRLADVFKELEDGRG